MSQTRIVSDSSVSNYLMLNSSALKGKKRNQYQTEDEKKKVIDARKIEHRRKKRKENDNKYNSSKKGKIRKITHQAKSVRVTYTDGRTKDKKLHTWSDEKSNIQKINGSLENIILKVNRLNDVNGKKYIGEQIYPEIPALASSPLPEPILDTNQFLLEMDPLLTHEANQCHQTSVYFTPSSLLPDQEVQKNPQIHSSLVFDEIKPLAQLQAWIEENAMNVGDIEVIHQNYLLEAGGHDGTTEQSVELAPVEKQPTPLFGSGMTFFQPSVVSNPNHDQAAQADTQLTDKTDDYLNFSIPFEF